MTVPVSSARRTPMRSTSHPAKIRVGAYATAVALVRPPIWALLRSNASLRNGASGPTHRRERKTTRYADHTTPSATKR